MKNKIYLFVMLCAGAFSANSQFVLKPLNYQVPGDHYLIYNYSIVDADHVWLGTIHTLSNWLYAPYPYAVHTADGGDTWIFDSIPAIGEPYICNVSALSASTCYYTFIDGGINGYIWKTTDGGATWTLKTTTQFIGGYLNFYHAFNANDGVAVGNPNSGYFEIQRTADGGDTWTRVDASSIPPPLAGEKGGSDCYSVLGDVIWFSTTKGRCFESYDKGAHWVVWTASPINGDYDVAFSSALKGAFYDWGTNSSSRFYKTSDGGTSWSVDSISAENMIFGHMFPVEGFDGGFVYAVYDQNTYFTNVYFTPDFFTTTVTLGTNLMAAPYLKFKDATKGWLAGWGDDTNNIYKFTGILSSVFEAAKTSENLSIMPNPTANEALVKLPASFNSQPLEICIIDMTGMEIESWAIASSTGWTKLNASGYRNGIYLVELLSGTSLSAHKKWVVQH